MINKKPSKLLVILIITTVIFLASKAIGVVRIESLRLEPDVINADKAYYVSDFNKIRNKYTQLQLENAFKNNQGAEIKFIGNLDEATEELIILQDYSNFVIDNIVIRIKDVNQLLNIDKNDKVIAKVIIENDYYVLKEITNEISWWK